MRILVFGRFSIVVLVNRFSLFLLGLHCRLLALLLRGNLVVARGLAVVTKGSYARVSSGTVRVDWCRPVGATHEAS